MSIGGNYKITTSTTTTSSSRPSGLRAPAAISRSSASSLTNLSSGILNEDTDGFIVGDRVWVGGTKAGVIQYIGETQFAPGVWGGVVLDSFVGKNNGSVAGVQYFQCEPKRGVFSRLTKLTREPIESLIRAEQQSLLDVDSPSKANGSVRSTSPAGRSQTRSSTPASSSSIGASIGQSSSLSVGDRVQVTSAVGIKNGTLRYLGTTDFAPGEWAGIELDNATGKNDGAVEGTRYFNCPMKYGLFAPVHKVSKSGANRRATATIGLTPSPRRTTTMVPKLSGSRDSISTIGSASTSRTGPRLGINSLTSRSASKPSRSNAASVTATHTAMQEALKEKEQHIEQLMKERDMERAEVVRAAAQVDEAERELSSAKSSFQNRIEEADIKILKLHEDLADNNNIITQLKLQLDDEKKKVEDLQFRLEEEAITKGDLERTAIKSQEIDNVRIRELEELLNNERTRAEKLESESNVNFQSEEELLSKHLDEIEELKSKLKQTEALVKSMEATKQELVFDCEKVLTTQQAVNTESLAKVSNLQCDLERTTKFKEELQITNSDLRRSLEAMQQRMESIVQQKEILEADVMEQMKSSGDNSTQLIKLSEQLRDKDRETESLRQREQILKQQTERLEELNEQLRIQHQREVETLGTKHWEEISRLEEAVHTAHSETEKICNNHDVQLAEWEYKLEGQDGKMTAMASQLADALKTAENGRKAVEQTTRVLTEKDAVVIEKSQLMNTLSVVEQENSQLKDRVSQLEVERSDHAKAVGERDAKLALLNEQVERLKGEFDRHRVELQRQLAETNLDQNTMMDMRNHLETQQKNLVLSEERLRQANEEKDRLTQELARVEAVFVTKCADMKENSSELIKQLQDSQTNVAQLESSHQVATETLQKKLDATQALLEESGRKVCAVQEQMSIQNQRLLDEKARLESQLILQSSNSPVADNKSTIDLDLQKVLEDKEALEMQIEFLNSVIVDMQRKTDELLSTINVLQHMNDHIDDVNLNAINANGKVVIPPRLFCDICEMFDLHETDDCPRQDTSMEGPAPSQCHGTRNQERPYCNGCEVFGHWTNECDDNETF